MQDTAIPWEVWDQGNQGITTAPAKYFAEQSEKGTLPVESKLLHRFVAATSEEAMALRDLRMGHGPYVPSGDPEQFPNGCGSFYYPCGSGTCPYCGKVRKPTFARQLPGFEAAVKRHFADMDNSAPAITRLMETFGSLELNLHQTEMSPDHTEELLRLFCKGWENETPS